MFRIKFSVGEFPNVQKDVPENWGILDIKDGFWVNTRLDPTNGSDAKYFVMAHHINFVQKVDPNEESK